MTVRNAVGVGLVVVLSLSGCEGCSSVGTIEDPHLLGFVAVERDAKGLRYVFDEAHRPYVIAARTSESIIVTLDARTVPFSRVCEARCRIDVTTPTGLPSGRLAVADRVWRVRFVPTVWPSLGKARALADQERWDEAHAALDRLEPRDRLERLAVAVERASYRRRAGDDAGYGDAVEAWARLAEQLDVPSEHSRALRTLAFRAFYRRDFDAVAPLVERSRLIDRAIDNPSGLVRAASYESLVLRELGQFREAMRVAQEGKRIARANYLDQDAAIIAMGIARISIIVGDYHRAVAELDLAEQSVGGHDLPDLLVERGWALAHGMASGVFEPDWLRPRKDLERALRLARGTGLRIPEANALVDLVWLAMLAGSGDVEARVADLGAVDLDAHPLARVFLTIVRGEQARRRGDRESARRFFETALGESLADATGEVSDVTWRALFGLAQTAADDGRLSEASGLFERSLDALERLARHVEIRRGRALFAQDRAHLVDGAIEVAVRRGEVEQAVAIAERARRQVFDSLATPLLVDRLEPDVRRTWRSALDAYEVLRVAYEKRRSAEELVPVSELAAFRSETEDQRIELERRFDTVFTIVDDRLVDASTRLRPDDVAHLVTTGSALLYFHPSADRRVFAFFLHAGGVESSVLEAATIEPWRARIEVLNHLTIVPPPGADPWSSIGIDDSPQFGKASISFAPFAGLLIRKPPEPRPARALVVADPESNLASAREEAGVVARHRSVVTQLVGPQATRRAVLDALRTATDFHFSGHGALFAERPWDASLTLARGETLTVEDLLVVRPALNHVVLSGCQTGRAGRLSRVAFLGLADAFLLAGASTVVASTRDIEDREALRFVKAFYAAGGADDPIAAYAAVAREDAKLARAFYVAGGPRP